MHANDPLHGVTLERLLTDMVEQHGWAFLAQRVNINCFKSDPSIKSSLKFLRRTPWARQQVEDLYLSLMEEGKNEANPWGKWGSKLLMGE